MHFLVYTVEPLDNNATLSGLTMGTDNDVGRIIEILNKMGLERVVNNQTVNLLVDNVDYEEDSRIVTADLYKQKSPGKALHQLAENGGEMTIQEIISENENAFVQGTFGMKKIGNEIHLIIETNFGSFFVAACKGLEITPRYSSETIRSIQESETIGKTTLDFAEDYDLTASLLKSPEDSDIREEQGFGKINLINKFSSLFSISDAHRISLDIGRDEWLNNVDIFEELIESGIVTTVRIEGTRNGVVKLGQGGDRAIRKKIKTERSDKTAVKEAFYNFVK